MKKLQGYHLTLFVLAYIASVGTYPLSIDSNIRQKVPSILSTIPYAEHILAAAAFFATGASEHALLIWSMVCGYKGLKALAGKRSVRGSVFFPSLMCASMLAGVYNGTIPKESIWIAYTGLGVANVLLIASQKTDSDNAIEDLTLSHLIFYFTK